jgi:beta-glucosidase
MGQFQFPAGFLWGAATSSHQVEGGNRNDWTEWEAQSAKLKVESAKFKNWQDFILKNYPNPLQEENYISGRACDHYHRFREDFDIAKSLGHNAHRFSIEWSRIEPEEGKFNEREIEHYREVISALRERGMEPFVTLWHWTLPLWVRDKGGVENKNFPKYFSSYVEKILYAFKDDVRFWITLNEPEIYTFDSYVKGVWPPQKRSLVSALRVIRNLVRSHKLAHEKIYAIAKDARVGIAKNNIYFDNLLAPFLNRVWNFWFLDKISSTQDFIGLNYYFRGRGYSLKKNEDKEVSDMGWESYPEGVYPVLKDLQKYNRPIYITENGIADARDEKRAQFIKDHLRRVVKAMQEGVDVRGYFYWSLLDNFEWDKGFWPRFGLVEVDYKTLERKIRPSAWAYRRIIEEGLQKLEPA